VVKKQKENENDKAMRPGTSPEAREQQLVNLAVNLAEKQLRDGSAAPSVINHFLKIASTREVIEREMLEKQSKLIEAKAQSFGKDRSAEELAKAAIEAMRNYNPGAN
jgi:hypothetical protein